MLAHVLCIAECLAILYPKIDNSDKKSSDITKRSSGAKSPLFKIFLQLDILGSAVGSAGGETGANGYNIGGCECGVVKSHLFQVCVRGCPTAQGLVGQGSLLDWVGESFDLFPHANYCLPLAGALYPVRQKCPVQNMRTSAKCCFLIPLDTPCEYSHVSHYEQTHPLSNIGRALSMPSVLGLEG